MPVNIIIWRQRIGTFNCIKLSKSEKGTSYSFHSFLSGLFFVFWYLLKFTHDLLPLKLICGVFSIFFYCNLILFFSTLVLFYKFLINLVYHLCRGRVSICYGTDLALPFFITVISLSRMMTRKSAISLFLSFFISNLKFILRILQILLISSGSVEINPGPDDNKQNILSFAMWNLDSLPARDFSRVPVIESLQAVHNFDLFAICESSLTDIITNDKIFIHGFSPDPFRADKPLFAHSGGVCLFYKENTALKRRTDLELLEETIVAELSQKNNTKLFFILSYRHPNQSIEEVDSYFSSLNDIIEKIENEKPKGIILTGDFNARSPFFWESDADTTEGRILGEVSILNNLEQLVNEPTHIRDDGTQTCIDLIFTNCKHMHSTMLKFCLTQ